MALIKPLTFPQLGKSFDYWRIQHVVFDRSNNRLAVHLWGRQGPTGEPGKVLRWEIPVSALPDPNAVSLEQAYGLVRTHAPLDEHPWQIYTSSPLADASDG